MRLDELRKLERNLLVQHAHLLVVIGGNQNRKKCGRRVNPVDNKGFVFELAERLFGEFFE